MEPTYAYGFVCSGGETPLHTAAQAGHVLATRALLHCGADVNKADSGGFTALHEAARNGHSAVVQLLMSFGADWRKQDGTGKTPLQRARSAGHAPCERVLREGRVAVDPSDLREAARKGDATALEGLIRAGGKRIVNANDSLGQTALYAAASNGHVALIKILFEAGADPNQATINGEVALHGAAGKQEERTERERERERKRD